MASLHVTALTIVTQKTNHLHGGSNKFESDSCSCTSSQKYSWILHRHINQQSGIFQKSKIGFFCFFSKTLRSILWYTEYHNCFFQSHTHLMNCFYRCQYYLPNVLDLLSSYVSKSVCSMYILKNVMRIL